MNENASCLVRAGWPWLDAPFVAVVDAQTTTLLGVSEFLARAAAIRTLTHRPNIEEADAICELARRTHARWLISVGAGVAIDAAKLAVWRHRTRTGVLLGQKAVPCGPEPYRAVTPFVTFDRSPNTRETVHEDWLLPTEAGLVAELLDQLDPTVLFLSAGDSLVHAIESLVSTLSNDESERHAVFAARTLASQATVHSPDRVALVTAAFSAARAFDSTKLGLAHALARPLGVAAGRSHDAFNLMLGARVAFFWGDEILRASALPPLGATGRKAEPWCELLESYRRRAGLPSSLAEAGLQWRDIRSALEWAPKSSGFCNLPRPVRSGDLERIMEAAWCGSDVGSTSVRAAERPAR